MKVPDGVIEIRKALCADRCNVDFNDPCIGCPNGHWGAYTLIDCPPPPQTSDVVLAQNGLRRSTIKSPGDAFAKVVFKITGQVSTGCGTCGARRLQMNQWGWWGCWKHRKEIVGWMVEECRKRGYEVNENSIFDLFKAALHELKNG